MLAPREAEHSIRPIPVGDIPSRPWAERIEWVVRLALIFAAAVIIGTGLTDKGEALITVFGWALPEATRAAVMAGLEQGDAAGVLIQFAYVLVGFAMLAAACWPVPGMKTRPGAYLAGSFGQRSSTAAGSR